MHRFPTIDTCRKDLTVQVSWLRAVGQTGLQTMVDPHRQNPRLPKANFSKPRLSLRVHELAESIAPRRVGRDVGLEQVQLIGLS